MHERMDGEERRERSGRRQSGCGKEEGWGRAWSSNDAQNRRARGKYVEMLPLTDMLCRSIRMRVMIRCYLNVFRVLC